MPSPTASGGRRTPRADERRVGWSPLGRGVGVARRPASSCPHRPWRLRGGAASV